MATVSVGRKWASLLVVGAFALALQVQLFATIEPVNTVWQVDIVHEESGCGIFATGGWEPCGSELWCETLYTIDVYSCYNDEWTECEEDEWLSLDMAWACAADCDDNTGSGWTDHDWYEVSSCEFACTCTQ